MSLKAIIFDVDGTLADTERLGHLPACNEAFEQMGLPIHWDWGYFQELMPKIQGNANRLRYVLQKMPNLSEVEIDSIVNEFEPLKKKLYINKFLPQLELREGVKSFIQKLCESGVRLAIVSTSYEAQINALLKNQLPEFASFFKPVLGKESGVKTGEDGILYTLCLNRLGLSAKECLVIEDSQIGMEAAIKAGIPTIVTYNDYTKEEDFSGSEMQVSSLAELNIEQIINGDFKTSTI